MNKLKERYREYFWPAFKSIMFIAVGTDILTYFTNGTFVYFKPEIFTTRPFLLPIVIGVLLLMTIWMAEYMRYSDKKRNGK